MGNLAVKCENEYRARKIDVRCVGGALDVRVMRADGTEVEEFDRPVVVAEVMYQFPDYAVVQWCPNHNIKLGKRGQLRVLQRHEVLKKGQIYILFPIPVEMANYTNPAGGGNARRSRRMQSAKSRLDLLLQRSEMAAADNKEKLGAKDVDGKSSDLEREHAQLSFPGFATGGERSIWLSSSAGSGAEFEEETRVLASGNQERTLVGVPMAVFPPGVNSNWRPALLSIPESPVGFHSRPGSSPNSPRTPIAFRLVSVREQQQ